MTAIFRVEQLGAFPPVSGAWDMASRNIQLVGAGGVVTFTARDPATSYLWELISEPPGAVTPIVGPNLSACQVSFTKTGGYLMRLTVDAGILGSEDISVRYMGIRLTNSNLPIPAFNELDFDNSYTDPCGSSGTAEKLTTFFKWMDATIGAGLGDLPITQTVYVDGARTDVYMETGSFAFPFKTLQPAIDAAQVLADAVAGEACVYIRPFKYTDVGVTLPSNVHIDAELGAELHPSAASDGIVVVPGNFPAMTALSAVFIRGLNVAGVGYGHWALKITNPLGLPNPPTVVHMDAGLGTYVDPSDPPGTDGASCVLVEAGALYLTDAGGNYGDASPIGIQVTPPLGSPFGAIALINAFNLMARDDAFVVDPGGAIIATATKVDAFSPPMNAVVRIDGGASVALFQGNNLRVDSEAVSMVVQTGNAWVQLNTVDGATPLLGGCTGDIFQIHQGSLNLSGGAYNTRGGRGLALLGDDGPVQCVIRDADIFADGGYLIETADTNSIDLRTYQTRFQGTPSTGRVFTRLAHGVGGVYLDGGIIDGGSGGGAPSTILDLVSGTTWLTGGCDINADSPFETAIHVSSIATLLHGHANVRLGAITVDPGGADLAATSSFGNLQLGRYDAITKWTSRATLAEVAFELDYPHGSILVVTGDPAEPLVYINYGTDLARDWRLLGANNPVVRVQREDMGGLTPINLNGKTRTGPALLPISWQTTDYDDVPPFSIWDPRVVQVTEEGDYKLSYHFIWQSDAVLAFGSTVGIMWERSLDGGGTWAEIPPTLSYDSTPNVFNNYGANDLAPYELHLALGTCLRLKAWLAGINGNVYIDAFGPGPAYENGSWARVERDGSGGGGGGGPVPTDWVVEFVTTDRVLTAADHKKHLIALNDPGGFPLTITLPLAPFVGQELRIIHGGSVTPGPLAGELRLIPATPTDRDIGVADSSYSVLAAMQGGCVAHILCVDDGPATRFWGCTSGSGTWYDPTHLSVFSTSPPYSNNQFYLNFQSPFKSSRGGASATQLYEESAIADGVFSLAFGYNVHTTKEYSLAYGNAAEARWVGEEVFSSGGFRGAAIGSAQKSSINLYGETVPGTPGNVTPTGLNGLTLTVADLKVYACELLVVAASTPRMPGPPLAAAWKMEFLVHGMGAPENAVIVGSINKNQFSRDPSPIIDTWDVNVSIGGPGVPLKDLAVTVYQGVVGGDNVRWDAVLTMAQVGIDEMPS